MKDIQLKEFLESEGYSHIREVPEQGVCGISRFIYTVGLSVGLDKYGRRGRYCFHSMREAVEALESWSGAGDPSGNWIKYKGAVEYSNLNYKENL